MEGGGNGRSQQKRPSLISHRRGGGGLGSQDTFSESDSAPGRGRGANSGLAPGPRTISLGVAALDAANDWRVGVGAGR